jgi:serine/threonine protein kinase
MNPPAGAYGLVLPYPLVNERQEYPTNVTKIFFRKQDYNSILEKQKRISNIFQGDRNYLVHPFDTPVSMATVRQANRVAVSQKIKRSDDPNGYHVDTPSFPNIHRLYAVHMPHLGVDMTHIKDNLESLRAVPVHTMLTNIYKLLEKVAMLWDDRDKDKQFIHGDVRPPNIMIQPDTGKMTLIDFDWLYPVNVFKIKYPFNISPNIPPELLMYGTRKMIKLGSSTIDILLPLYDEKQLQMNRRQIDELHYIVDQDPYYLNRVSYCKESLRIFTYLHTLDDNGKMYNMNIYKRIVRDTQYLSVDIYARFPTYQDAVIASLRTFDGYGASQNLLELCHLVYPGSIKESIDSPSITDNEKKALYAMINHVLKPMCDMSLDKRKHVSEVLEIASSIASLDLSNGAPANEKPANEKPANGAPVNNVKSANQGNKQGGTRLKRATPIKRTKHTKRTKRTRRHNRTRQ